MAEPAIENLRHEYEQKAHAAIEALSNKAQGEPITDDDLDAAKRAVVVAWERYVAALRGTP